MRKLMLVMLVIGAGVILAACGDSDEDTKSPTATPEPPPLPLQSSLIITVEGTGDVASEAILLENRGPTLNLSGWKIVGPAGQTFTFPDYMVFEGAATRIYSRAGENTPLALYWGSSEALWSPGSTITVQDAEGQPQALAVIGE
jgi:hypothetical protein